MPEFNTEIIWQVIGFIALWFAFFAFKETDDKKLLIYLALCSFVWSIHFWILWLFAAAGINAFDIFKNLAWLKWKKNTYWITFFIFAYILIGITTYQYTNSLISFIPTIASVLWVIWVLCFKGISMRLFLISTLVMWFIYNYVWWSYAWMVSDVVLIWATLYWIYKLRKFK